MNAIELQNLIFPKYQEFVEQQGRCPNTLLVGLTLAHTLWKLHVEPFTTYAGMHVIFCDRLKPNEFKLGVLL